MMSSIYSLPSARDKVSRFEEREGKKRKKKDHEKGGKKVTGKKPENDWIILIIMAIEAFCAAKHAVTIHTLTGTRHSSAPPV